MDTYGDMVTLLLCFFVMLYSMSSVDQNRWIALVQALNPDAVVAQGSMEVAPPDGSVVTQEEIDQEIQELYESMEDYIQQANMTGRVIELPNREDIDLDVEEHLIVELYSK